MAETAGNTILEIRGVETFYGNIQALHGVDMAVRQGEIVTLIGANGAGKSTLLMTVCGNPQARTGSVWFEGEEITREPTFAIVRRGIAQSPEGRRIFPKMTVLENLQLSAITAPDAHFQRNLDAAFDLFPRLAERRAQRGVADCEFATGGCVRSKESDICRLCSDLRRCSPSRGATQDSASTIMSSAARLPGRNAACGKKIPLDR